MQFSPIDAEGLMIIGPQCHIVRPLLIMWGVFDNPLYANIYATYVNNTHKPVKIFYVYF